MNTFSINQYESDRNIKWNLFFIKVIKLINLSYDPFVLIVGVPQSTLEPDVSIFTDTSTEGWGAHLES